MSFGAFHVKWYQKMDFSAGPDSDFDNFWYTLRSIHADLKNQKKKFFDPPRKKLGGVEV